MPEKSKKPPKRFKRRYLILLAGILIALYTLMNNANRISVEAQRLWLHYQLDMARQKWEANNPTRHRLEMTYRGPFQGGTIDKNIHFQLTYSLGSLVGVVPRNKISETFPFPETHDFDIETAFKSADNMIEAIASINFNSYPEYGLSLPLSIFFEFNEDYGYPKFIYFCEANVIVPDGCWYVYTITNFEIADNVIPFTSITSP